MTGNLGIQVEGPITVPITVYRKSMGNVIRNCFYKLTCLDEYGANQALSYTARRYIN
jgi:hypothetical protein